MSGTIRAPDRLVGTTGTSTFRVAQAHTTTAFGEQEMPPGRPAAADATAEETVSVLGTGHLLSRVEFTGRESLNGEIPAETGVVGQRATVDHTGPAAVGTELQVTTEVTAVDGPTITYDGRVATDDGDREIGTAEVALRIVERDRFRSAVANQDR
ncbi:thioesterase family protein [Halorientalis salina]|uniref:thioesterase family protein n=1 Tax=Halorientalis salina TaxID=2932266 RepID=UPI0010ABD703|nr:hotdog domain-containing protein [Halorientalis salina]